MSEYFFGVDFGGTNTKLGMLTEQGEIIARRSIPSEVEKGPIALVDRIAKVYQDLLAENHLDRQSVRAAGVGSPGPLSVAEGMIIKSGNIPGFGNFRFRAELSRRLGIGVVFDNDANVACWGEFWQGAGKEIKHMVLFTLGTGIGGGIIYDGELIHGSDDNGAELGHMIIQPDGRLCNCGQHGCLEAYASANNTALRAIEALDQGRDSTLQEVRRKNGTLTCKDVFDHARAGDGLANETVDGTARALGQACVNMRHITEPQQVVLTGGMIASGDILLPRVRDFYQKMMWTSKPEPMDICLAKLGNDAGIIGAGGLALHTYRQKRLSAVGC